MKYSKTRQLKVLRAAKKSLQQGDDTFICCGISWAERRLNYPLSPFDNSRMTLYGMDKYKPKKAGIAWWHTTEAGRKKRIEVLNKRIKALTNNK